MAPNVLSRLDLRGERSLNGRVPRPEVTEEPVTAVRAILEDVRRRGDSAVRDCTERFDGLRLETLAVEPGVLRDALRGIGDDQRAALEAAAASVRLFHETQVVAPQVHVEDGVTVQVRRQPVDRAGLYVPGGRAAYPSTVLMTAIPARVAGVAEVALCVPPGPDGSVARITLAAAGLAGVDEVYAVGGAQAIAAMAYGTESIERVDVIAGPGNLYVAIAKREVGGVVGVPAAFTGPSEIVVVADSTAPVGAAAIDVLVQAEHGPDGLAWLVTWEESTLEVICARIEELVATAPRRAEIEATLARGGYAALVDGPEQAIELVNHIAPEHLELMTADPEALVPMVRNAGAVFCGPWSAASIGDYLAGPSHVLPTFGSARFGSALTVDDFQKHLHVITVDEAGFRRVAPWVEILAAAEGLEAHADSVRLRREELG